MWNATHVWFCIKLQYSINKVKTSRHGVVASASASASALTDGLQLSYDESQQVKTELVISSCGIASARKSISIRPYAAYILGVATVVCIFRMLGRTTTCTKPFWASGAWTECAAQQRCCTKTKTAGKICGRAGVSWTLMKYRAIG